MNLFLREEKAKISVTSLFLLPKTSLLFTNKFKIGSSRRLRGYRRSTSYVHVNKSLEPSKSIDVFRPTWTPFILNSNDLLYYLRVFKYGCRSGCHRKCLRVTKTIFDDFDENSPLKHNPGKNVWRKMENKISPDFTSKVIKKEKGGEIPTKGSSTFLKQ